MVGTPLLLWRVENESNCAECVGGERDDGCYWTRVTSDGRDSEFAIFATQGEAIRWSLDRELELFQQGWRRVL